MNFPPAWREFSHTRGRVLPHTLQHVDQLGVGIDAVQSAGDHQALNNADVFSAEFRPTKEPGLAAHRNDAERALEVIGIHRHVGIG